MLSKRGLLILGIVFIVIIIGVILINFQNSPQNLNKSNAENDQITLSPIQDSTFKGGTFKGVREEAKVSFVFDGDTIELSDKRKVRYIGIDAPEMNFNKGLPDCFASQSAHTNEQLVKSQTVEMENDEEDVDKYGRLLRYVYIDGIFINDFLIRQGFAKAMAIPPDTKYSQQLQEAENEAKENNRGLWQSCQ